MWIETEVKMAFERKKKNKGTTPYAAFSLKVHSI